MTSSGSYLVVLSCFYFCLLEWVFLKVLFSALCLLSMCHSPSPLCLSCCLFLFIFFFFGVHGWYSSNAVDLINVGDQSQFRGGLGCLSYIPFGSPFLTLTSRAATYNPECLLDIFYWMSFHNNFKSVPALSFPGLAVLFSLGQLATQGPSGTFTHLSPTLCECTASSSCGDCLCHVSYMCALFIPAAGVFLH